MAWPWSSNRANSFHPIEADDTFEISDLQDCWLWLSLVTCVPGNRIGGFVGAFLFVLSLLLGFDEFLHLHCAHDVWWNDRHCLLLCEPLPVSDVCLACFFTRFKKHLVSAGVLSVLVPESPGRLVTKGKLKEARGAIIRLIGPGHNYVEELQQNF